MPSLSRKAASPLSTARSSCGKISSTEPLPLPPSCSKRMFPRQTTSFASKRGASAEAAAAGGASRPSTSSQRPLAPPSVRKSTFPRKKKRARVFSPAISSMRSLSSVVFSGAAEDFSPAGAPEFSSAASFPRAKLSGETPPAASEENVMRGRAPPFSPGPTTTTKGSFPPSSATRSSSRHSRRRTDGVISARPPESS